MGYRCCWASRFGFCVAIVVVVVVVIAAAVVVIAVAVVIAAKYDGCWTIGRAAPPDPTLGAGWSEAIAPWGARVQVRRVYGLTNR